MRGAASDEQHDTGRHAQEETMRMTDDAHGAEAPKHSSTQAPAELTPWVHTLAAELGIDAADVPTGALLRITRDVAHAITRPAGPVTTYLMGVAIARGASYEDAAATVESLVQRWGDAGVEGGAPLSATAPEAGPDPAASRDVDATDAPAGPQHPGEQR